MLSVNSLKIEDKFECWKLFTVTRIPSALRPRIRSGPKKIHVQGVFLTGAPLRVLSVSLQSKSYQKSSKCQNLLTGWHLGFFGGHQLKKTPCILDIVRLS